MANARLKNLPKRRVATGIVGSLIPGSGAGLPSVFAIARCQWRPTTSGWMMAPTCLFIRQIHSTGIAARDVADWFLAELVEERYRAKLSADAPIVAGINLSTNARIDELLRNDPDVHPYAFRVTGGLTAGPASTAADAVRAADVWGYWQTYYSPPSEEIISGIAAQRGDRAFAAMFDEYGAGIDPAPMAQSEIEAVLNDANNLQPKAMEHDAENLQLSTPESVALSLVLLPYIALNFGPSATATPAGQAPTSWKQPLRRNLTGVV